MLVVVSSLVVVILEDEVAGYVGNSGMKTFIFLSYSARQILLVVFLTLHKNYLVAQLVCFLSGKRVNVDGTH